MTPRVALVLEQTLGHVAHTRNLERAAAREESCRVELLKIPFVERTGLRRLPGVGTWSVHASLATRTALSRLEIDGPVDAAFIHTQVAALASTAFMRRVPTIISLDATPINLDAEGAAYGHRRNPAPVEWLKREVNRRALHAASSLVTWSELAARSLVADYAVDPDRISVVPPGVDTELFRPADRPSPLAPPRVLFVGGDFKRKGGPELLEAAAALDSPVEIDVVTGTADIQVPAGLRVRVHRGLRPQEPALVELFRAADVFCLPTRGDCLPQVLAEAMACGLPVVSTRVGAISEVVRDGENGFLVTPGDVSDLRAALQRLAATPSLRSRFGAASLGLARREHDAMRNNGRIFEMLRQLSASGRRLQEQVA